MHHIQTNGVNIDHRYKTKNTTASAAAGLSEQLVLTPCSTESILISDDDDDVSARSTADADHAQHRTHLTDKQLLLSVTAAAAAAADDDDDAMLGIPPYPSITPSLTSAPLSILSIPGKGRGVFAKRAIVAGEVIEISPVLCISRREYYGSDDAAAAAEEEDEDEDAQSEARVRKGVNGSVLRGYVFTWKGREGGMALALGIGSLFNHSTAPNVSFVLSYSTYTIQYKTFRAIEAGEELCIFYGHATRFAESEDPSDPSLALAHAAALANTAVADDIWGGLGQLGTVEDIGFVAHEEAKKQTRGSRRSAVKQRAKERLEEARNASFNAAVAEEEDEESSVESETTKIEEATMISASMTTTTSSDDSGSELSGMRRCYKVEDIIHWDQLPWRKVTEVVESSNANLTTFDCWVVNMPARSAQLAFDFVKAESTQFDALSHLKRVRKLDEETLSILLFPVDRAPPDVPGLLAKSTIADVARNPYILPVPAVVARTHAQYVIWTQVWPVAMVVIREGPKAVPITSGWERTKREWIGREIGKVWREAEAAGQRGEHPIACHVTDSYDVTTHSIDNLPKTLVKASDSRVSTGNVLAHAACNMIDAVAVLDRQGLRDPPLHSHLPFPYLLTGLTVFTSHEPCLLCSMSLLHSRIAQLYYVKPASGSGGCGSVYGVHEDGGLNHRFEVWEWRGGVGSGAELAEFPSSSVVGVGLDVLLDP